MLQIVLLTMKGIFRDRIFQGIMAAALLFLAIPQVSTLSMRQVTELSITLGLSLFSFIMMLIAVFLGVTSLWRDIERRYTSTLLGFPLSRYEYVFGRFCGTALFLALVGTLLAIIVLVETWLASRMFPPMRPVIWQNIIIAAGFDILKNILIIGLAFLFSSLSTSFFLPVFGVIILYFVGSASQDVHEFILAGGKSVTGLPPLLINSANALYYVIPNLSGFDFKLHAIYGLPVTAAALGLTSTYFIVYTAICVVLSAIFFGRREMQ